MEAGGSFSCVDVADKSVFVWRLAWGAHHACMHLSAGTFSRPHLWLHECSAEAEAGKRKAAGKELTAITHASTPGICSPAPFPPPLHAAPRRKLASARLQRQLQPRRLLRRRRRRRRPLQPRRGATSCRRCRRCTAQRLVGRLPCGRRRSTRVPSTMLQRPRGCRCGIQTFRPGSGKPPSGGDQLPTPQKYHSSCECGIQTFAPKSPLFLSPDPHLTPHPLSPPTFICTAARSAHRGNLSCFWYGSRLSCTIVPQIRPPSTTSPSYSLRRAAPRTCATVVSRPPTYEFAQNRGTQNMNFQKKGRIRLLTSLVGITDDVTLKRPLGAGP
eukprot:361762-Chlamydomonas_euryale.AAC.7